MLRSGMLEINIGYEGDGKPDLIRGIKINGHDFKHLRGRKFILQVNEDGQLSIEGCLYGQVLAGILDGKKTVNIEE